MYGYTEEGDYSYSDKAAGFGTCFKIKENLIFGISGKMIIEKIYSYSGKSFLIDTGILYRSKNLRVAFTLQNIGEGVKFIKIKEKSPLLLKLGVSYNVRNLLISTEIEKESHSDFVPKIGMEFKIKNLLFLRAGFILKNDYYGDKVSKITAGIGIKILNYSFDYAFIPYGILGNTHYFSISGEF